jgi:hypothetical protein
VKQAATAPEFTVGAPVTGLKLKLRLSQLLRIELHFFVNEESPQSTRDFSSELPQPPKIAQVSKTAALFMKVSPL